MEPELHVDVEQLMPQIALLLRAPGVHGCTRSRHHKLDQVLPLFAPLQLATASLRIIQAIRHAQQGCQSQRLGLQRVGHGREEGLRQAVQLVAGDPLAVEERDRGHHEAFLAVQSDRGMDQ